MKARLLGLLALLLPRTALGADTAATATLASTSTTAGSGWEGAPMNFGPLFEMLATTNNLLIMVGCGAMMELWKRGPITRNWTRTRWGKLGAYWAPFLWCSLALFAPVGLAPAGAGLGQKAMLAVILGMLTSGVYDRAAGSLKHLRAPPASPAPPALDPPSK